MNTLPTWTTSLMNQNATLSVWKYSPDANGSRKTDRAWTLMLRLPTVLRTSGKALTEAAKQIGLPLNPADDYEGDHIEWVGPLRLCLASPEENSMILWQGSWITSFTLPDSRSYCKPSDTLRSNRSGGYPVHACPSTSQH